MRAYLTKIIGIIIMLTPNIAFGQISQPYKEIRQMEGDIEYSIYFSKTCGRIENVSNKLINEPPYMLGSKPRKYYSYANGLCHSADVNMFDVGEVVRTVFSGLEIERYAEFPGYMHIYIAADSDSGKVLEVSFAFFNNGGKGTPLTIPLSKIYQLELLFKERIICSIPAEVQDEMPSYLPASCTLFLYDNL